MSYSAYVRRRGQLQTYFDRTASDAWARLTSTEPVSKIRATVRAGRDSMRDIILGYLPTDLSGQRLLDAGCGTGALSVAAALRGAEVVAVDLSATLISLAKERLPQQLNGGRIDFKLGDMSDVALGKFDHVVAMDSLIHYDCKDALEVVAKFADRTAQSIIFTAAPRTPALTLMHAVGRMFPRGDRAPAIAPVAKSRIRHYFFTEPRFRGWALGRGQLVSSGFYKSQVVELRRL
jgi:magnesium-protoporphyrin O-methyltransferase